MVVPGNLGRPAYRLYQLAWAGLDWLYPPQCGGCGKPGTRWCIDCQQHTSLLPTMVCTLCGRVLDTPGICSRCRTTPPPYSALRSWAFFNGALRNALHRLKYSRDLALGEILARPLVEMLRNLVWPVDLVTSVPMGVARQAERGYNQATLLAFPLSLACGIPFQSQALLKRRETRSQVGLNLAQRRDNVSGAFSARLEFVQNKSILLVDDVTTSGATIEACAHALINAGASQVFGLTLARAAIDQVKQA
jgi:competence protein ComFC